MEGSLLPQSATLQVRGVEGWSEATARARARAIISNMLRLRPADSVISEMKKIKSPGKVEVTAQAAVVAVGEGGEDGVERDTAVATMSSPQPPKTTIKMAYQTLNETYGVAGFFRGLSIRIPFYCLVVSLQFLLYDSIRVFLGVGRDDLNLFLDVLGGALGERMGDIM